ncbi:MAG: SPFH domain-containing protein [Ruminococcus flavefaciens]|nr:SPFH domain-containing protein [Ruminococcus flavefaciens]
MAIVEVVKYNGPSDVFAWKYPSEELGTWTQLIVNESQEAILFKGGKALDVFPSGRHTLETANIPILNKIVNLPFGGRSPFTAEVWYVNQLFKLDIKWGTASPIQIQDPKYGVFVPIRANGMFGIQVEDAKKFLVKLVGTAPGFDEQSIIRYFRGLYVTKVKDAVASYVVKKAISILEINAYIDELSVHMKSRIEPEMADYGIKLASFYVNEISMPEDDPAVKKLKSALAKKAEMNIIGYSYQQERSFNTMDAAVQNDSLGAAPFMGAGMGIGMGVGVGGAMAGSMSELAGQISVSNTTAHIECPHCHANVPEGQRFCGSCGYDMQKPVAGASAAKEGKKEAKCSNCGTVINHARFCPECGRKINPCPECGSDLPEGSVSCPVCGYKLPKKCPKCGSVLPNGTKFCPECGEAIAKCCPKCGRVNDSGSKFCSGCGEKLEGLA